MIFTSVYKKIVLNLNYLLFLKSPLKYVTTENWKRHNFNMPPNIWILFSDLFFNNDSHLSLKQWSPIDFLQLFISLPPFSHPFNSLAYRTTMKVIDKINCFCVPTVEWSFCELYIEPYLLDCYSQHSVLLFTVFTNCMKILFTFIKKKFWKVLLVKL